VKQCWWVTLRGERGWLVVCFTDPDKPDGVEGLRGQAG
jgi:hypothetical protein